MATKLALVLILSRFSWIYGYSQGAPPSQCDAMKPGHNFAPLETDVPFELAPEGQIVEAGQTVKLALKQTGADAFKGFMVQAYESGTNQRIGTFVLGSNDKGLQCGGISNSAVTHTNKNLKTNVQLTWKAPALIAVDKTVEFHFTVVKDYQNYWVNKIATNTVTITKSVDPEPEGEPEGEPEDSDPEGEYGDAEGQDGEAEEETGPKHEEYEGCFETKSCFGNKPDCVDKGDCQMFTSYSYDPTSKLYKFSLYLNDVQADKYVALGFSKDDKMGEDLVFYCQSNANQAVGVSYNNGKSNVKDVSGLEFASQNVTKQIDGSSICEFSLPEKVKFTRNGQEEILDLSSQEYTLLLARGPFSNQVGYHNIETPTISSPNQNLQLVDKVKISGKNWLVQIHAICMIFAWMSCAASGMLMARYYKNTWRSVRPLNKDLWFRLHQLFMVSTIALTSIGLVLIAIEKGPSPLAMDSVKINPHPVFGLIAIIATFIQPIMASIRPHPESEKRKFFNWAHWAVGNIGFLFSIVAIFFGIEYADVNLPESVSYVLIAYVTLHVLVHLVLTFQRCFLQHHGGSNRVKDVGDDDFEQDGNGSDLRKAAAFFYIGLVWIFSFVLVAWIVHQKIYQNDHEHHEHEEH